MIFYPWSVRPLPSVSFWFNLLSYFHFPNRLRSLHKLWRRCQSGLWCCVSLKTCAAVLSSLWPGGWALALAWSLPSSSGTSRFVSTPVYWIVYVFMLKFIVLYRYLSSLMYPYLAQYTAYTYFVRTNKLSVLRTMVEPQQCLVLPALWTIYLRSSLTSSVSVSSHKLVT